MCRKVDLFPFSGEGRQTPVLLGPLLRLASITVTEVPFYPHLKTETKAVSEILCVSSYIEWTSPQTH
jgi:hypothetical protein